MKLPVRTIAILDAKIDRTKIHEHLYDVQFSALLEDQYANLICIPVLHTTSSITATNLLFIAVNISVGAIHLKKGKSK